MIQGDGPIPARVMLCGEAPGDHDMQLLKPFVGPPGQELNKMLQEAGLLRSECFATNVVGVQPPYNDIARFIALKKKDITPQHVGLRDKFVLPVVMEGFNRLVREIKVVQPNVIVAFGNTALWALTGIWGVTKWRGSQLKLDIGGLPPIKVIPTIHPSAVIREWPWRGIVINDLRRAAREKHTDTYSNIPDWRFHIRPSFHEVVEHLTRLWSLLDDPEQTEWDCWLDFDLETKAGHIDCAGVSWSKTEGLSIPFMSWSNKEGYWQFEEELQIVWMLYKLLTHHRVKVRGQNLLYDSQYTHRHWHFVPRVCQDTMISQHAAFSGMRKSLDFQASLYCDYYVQWKPDKAAWKEGG